jgi:hypothetical protein
MLESEKREPLAVPTADFRLGDRIVLGLIALFALLTLICPLAAVFFRYEVNYNEGWNAYNALAAAQHLPLYGAQYGWTTVNYPALSFFIIAQLSSLTHDYLLTGRLLSIISFAVCSVFVGIVIRRFTARVAPVIFGAAFFVAIFCSQSPRAIGADDPQIFPLAFFLGTFLLYLIKRDRLNFGWISLIVLLFVTAGNIKHNYADFPLAVFVDLCLLSRRKAIQFALVSIPLIGLSFWLNVAYGGPYFFTNVLGHRGFDPSGLDFPPAIILPFVLSLAWAIKLWRDKPRRLISIFFLVSAVVGFGFGMGVGVSVNTFFSNFVAMSIVLALLLDSLWHHASDFFLKYPRSWRWGVPLAVCSSLAISFFFFSDTSDSPNMFRRLKEMPMKQRYYAAEVSFMKDHPGPAICQSMLRCFDAGKPYIYDPFNATRFMRTGKLNSGELVARIDAQQYSAIQLNQHVESTERPSDRFPDEVLDAIQRDYVIGVDDPGCAIYVPRQSTAAALE